MIKLTYFQNKNKNKNRLYYAKKDSEISSLKCHRTFGNSRIFSATISKRSSKIRQKAVQKKKKKVSAIAAPPARRLIFSGPNNAFGVIDVKRVYYGERPTYHDPSSFFLHTFIGATICKKCFSASFLVLKCRRSTK